VKRGRYDGYGEGKKHSKSYGEGENHGKSYGKQHSKGYGKRPR
jgi:hypothetical protein